MNELIERLLNEIPDYSQYLTIDELDASSAALAAAYPELVELSTVGYSVNGSPIQMLRIGAGSRRALFVGCPHPNEPIGASTLEYLSWKLCAEPSIIEGLDYTFYMIKAIDIDGYRRNEGWLKGPYTAERYIRHYYRPAGEEQVEWTFPYDYKTFKVNDPMPETQAFMRAIDEAKPHFLNSLHNIDRAGSYYYVSAALPEELYEQLRGLIVQRGLPLMKGEPESDIFPPLSDNIFKMGKFSEVYDYLTMVLPAEEDPAAHLGRGSSSSDYAVSRYGTYCFMSEVTCFADPRMGNVSLTDCTRRDIVEESLKQASACFDFFKRQLDLAAPFIADGGPLIRASTRFMGYFISGKERLERQMQQPEEQPKFDRLANEADQFDWRTRDWWLALGCVGMLVRAIDEQPECPELAAIRLETEQWLDGQMGELLAYLQCEMRPIRDLCAVQLGSALMVMEHLRASASDQ
ncbi:Zinc carboxypeptidase [Paenibacillus algorifonticola]|uniref:Zinc carboxypeptidase n=1 Tax=Paenibacillus algorifonticola TaxID=684063 RepID=A0A1I2IW85_9BACL|nr:M14 family zinc carboxypeptidase [Paenibacillus algorifonticola]SFF46665.1 Zinc carboxypeptidase [Paenibacillus algorifonticola]